MTINLPKKIPLRKFTNISLRGDWTMKRKILMLAVLVICVASVAVGSLAYFNAEGTAHNVITTGGVDITLQEWADDEKTQPFEDLTGIMPNTEVTKIAEIKNTGASEAWVRVKIEKTIELTRDGTPNTDMVALNINTADWTAGEDGYYYYNAALAPGETTAPVFTTVTFRPEMGNEYQNATAIVDVAAQAVQTANNGTAAANAAGWPAA